MPTLQWLTRDDDLKAAGRAPWADALEDRAVGEAWERAGGGLYLMVRARDDDGRDMLGQLTHTLRG